MPTLPRIIAMAIAIGALALGVGASAVAASSSLASAMAAERYDLSEEFCTDRGPTSLCTIVEASVVLTMNPDGRESARITVRQLATRTAADGTPIGSTRSSSFERTVFDGDGRSHAFTVGEAAGDGGHGSCAAVYRFSVVDYELRIERHAGAGC